MKKDYSEFEQTPYTQYRSMRANRKDVVFDYFQNYVRFFPEERSFRILVDSTKEYHSLHFLLEEYFEQERVREGITTVLKNSPEVDAELEEDREEQNARNATFLEQVSKKYDFDRDGADMDRDEFYAYNKDFSREPLINIYSGSRVKLQYGEGILDFIYADFRTPLKKHLAFSNMLAALREDYRTEHGQEDPAAVAAPEEAVHKIYNQTQQIAEAFLGYESAFSGMQDLMYASLYSAICPPMFADKFDIGKELRWYGNYLLLLQQEYLELIEFCYDESVYPSVLGTLYPSERYALYRDAKKLPSFSHRKEVLRLATNTMNGHTMPYGMELTKYATRVCNRSEITDEMKALAEHLGMDPDDVRHHVDRPHFMSIQYMVGSVAELLELEFTKMMESNVRFRKCKRCGRYFIMKGNYDTNYCDRVAEGETRNCQELAAAENYKAKIADNKAIPIYNKYYKRYAARVKARQIKEADFKKWKYQAITLRDECTDGKITVEEYIQWMEDSFPNRKPKT